MARRRFVVFLCLMLLMPYTPFFLERPTTTATPSAPPDSSRNWDRPERVQEIAKFLLTPTFPIHALWIAGLAVLSIVTVADVLMKIVFTCCTLGVEAVTGHRKATFVPDGICCRSFVSVWVHGIEHSLIRDVQCSTNCADLYILVSHMSGVPSHMLTLSNGVRILKRNDQLYNYISPTNLSHGLNLHCYIKNLGGGSGDELGRKNLKEHFPHQNWPILIVLLQIIRYTSYVMFTPSIYQFVTAARANIDELGNNENSTHFWSGLGGTETDYAWVIISSSACETVLIPVAVFILDILPFTAPLLLLMLMYAVGGALYASATEVWMAMLARGMMGGAGLFVSAVLHSYIGEMGTMMDKIRKKKGKRPLKNVLYMAVIFSINGANVLVLGVYVVFTRISSLNPYRSPGWFLTSLAILSVIIILLLYTEPRPWTCRKKCSRCSCKTGLGFSLKLRSKPKTQVMLIVFVFVCAYVNGQTLSVAFTLVAPILSDQFGFSVANSSLYFVALAVGCLTSCIIQLLVMVLKGNTRIVVGVGLTLCLVGCALLSDWQAIKDDENVCPSFNSSAYQCGDFILGEKETNNQTEHALHPCWQKGYEAQSSSDHLCFWNPQSRVTGECCTTCREACLSHQTSLNFYQFNVGVILVAVGSRIVYVFHLALVSDFVSVESQGIILTLAIGCGALSRVITPLWFVESYELTGKHTYLPMSITIGCLLVLLLALAALYKDLGPRSNQREIKAAISATFKLGISQELSSEKNEPAPITENGDAYKEGKEKREKEEAASVTEVGDQNEIDAYDNNSEPDDSQSAYYHLHYVWCETEM